MWYRCIFIQSCVAQLYSVGSYRTVTVATISSDQTLVEVSAATLLEHLWLTFIVDTSVDILGRFPFVRTDWPDHRWSCYFNNEIGFSQEFC